MVVEYHPRYIVHRASLALQATGDATPWKLELLHRDDYVQLTLSRFFRWVEGRRTDDDQSARQPARPLFPARDFPRMGEAGVGTRVVDAGAADRRMPMPGLSSSGLACGRRAYPAVAARVKSNFAVHAGEPAPASPDGGASRTKGTISDSFTPNTASESM